MDVFARLAFDRKCSLELAGNLQLAIGQPGLKLVGIDNRKPSRANGAADSGAVIAGFRLNREHRSGRQLQRRQIPRILDDATLASRTAIVGRTDHRLFRTAIQRDGRFLGSCGPLGFRFVVAVVGQVHALDGQVVLHDNLDGHDRLGQHVEIIARPLPRHARRRVGFDAKVPLADDARQVALADQL